MTHTEDIALDALLESIKDTNMRFDKFIERTMAQNEVTSTDGFAIGLASAAKSALVQFTTTIEAEKG